MWARWIGFFTLVAALAGCVDTLPDRVALAPEAQRVEIIYDAPNLEAYEPAGEVSARTIGHELSESRRQTEYALRNQAGAKGASFVLVEDATSRAAGDFSGRIVVSAYGTAFKLAK
ncbi:MAG: hypothetical protein FWD73_05170 [Polyangiaceae bacterium]|nr:hypothetical protein [Polyangiaceae bacterium]